MKQTSKYSDKEIIEKLKWFHGEEFDKYPLSEEFDEPDRKNGMN